MNNDNGSSVSKEKTAFTKAGFIEKIGSYEPGSIAISTEEQLLSMENDKSYYLSKDIKLTKQWSLDQYNRLKNVTLDGQGHIISNYYYNGPAYSGEVGPISSASTNVCVNNLGLEFSKKV